MIKYLTIYCAYSLGILTLPVALLGLAICTAVSVTEKVKKAQDMPRDMSTGVIIGAVVLDTLIELITLVAIIYI